MSRPIERCCACDEPTGRAGASDDSLFTDQEGIGPFCVCCYDGARHAESVLLPTIASLRSRLESAEKERDEARGQLCRAREALESGAKREYEDDAWDLITDALSSPSPCAHAEQLKELTERNAKLEEVAEKAKRWHEHGRLCVLGRFKTQDCSCGLHEFYAALDAKEGK